MPTAPTSAPTRTVARRWLQLCAAMVAAASGVGAMITAGVGVSPWDVFSTGLAATVGLTVGTSTFLLGAALLAVAVALGERLALGTLVTGLAFGPLVDVALGILGAPDALALRVLLFAAGFTMVATGIVAMMDADVGIGPAETFTNAACRRWGFGLARSRTALEVALLVIGVGLGGDLGWGTAAFGLGIGPAVALGLGCLGRRRSLDEVLAHAGPI